MSQSIEDIFASSFDGVDFSKFSLRDLEYIHGVITGQNVKVRAISADIEKVIGFLQGRGGGLVGELVAAIHNKGIDKARRSVFDVSGCFQDKEVIFATRNEMVLLQELLSNDELEGVEVPDYVNDDYTSSKVVVQGGYVKTKTSAVQMASHRFAGIIAANTEVKADGTVAGLVGRQANGIFKRIPTDPIAQTSRAIVTTLVHEKVHVPQSMVSEAFIEATTEDKIMAMHLATKSLPSYVRDKRGRSGKSDNIVKKRWQGKELEFVRVWPGFQPVQLRDVQPEEIIQSAITYIGPDKKGIGYFAAGHMDGLPVNKETRTMIDAIRDCDIPKGCRVIYLATSDPKFARYVFTNCGISEPFVLYYESKQTIHNYEEYKKRVDFIEEAKGVTITSVKKSVMVGVPVFPKTKLTSVYINLDRMAMAASSKMAEVQEQKRTIYKARKNHAQEYSENIVLRVGFQALLESDVYQVSALSRSGQVLYVSWKEKGMKAKDAIDFIMNAVIHASLYIWHRKPLFSIFQDKKFLRFRKIYNFKISDKDAGLYDLAVCEGDTAGYGLLETEEQQALGRKLLKVEAGDEVEEIEDPSKHL